MSFFQNIKMFLKGQSSDNSLASQDADQINHDMYKKSAELSNKNETLSLLQKLNVILLGSITHLNEIAQLVAYLLVKEAKFESVAIFLFSKKDWTLQRIAFSETEKSITIPYFTSIPLSKVENLVVKAVNQREKKQAPDLKNVLIDSLDFKKSEIIRELSHIKSVHIEPLVIKNELLGVLVMSLSEDEKTMSESRRDLLNRVVDTVGIGLDNALLYNKVQDANQKLIMLDKLKDEFVSVASHELRTPMTAIKSYLWMTLDGRGGPISDKQRFYLQRSYDSVDRLIRLINDMLNVSRIDSGRITIELNAVELPVMVQEVFDEVMPRAQELGLSLKMEPAQGLPKVLADKDKVKEVLFNLIGNSLKFTPKNGAVTVCFEQKDDFVETSVCDTGTGILEEDIPKLFQKFAMIDGSFNSDKAIQGTGLGLYISRSIIDLHRGKIWATSEGRGKGSRFTFSLPVFHEGDLPQIPEIVSEKKSVGIIHTEI